MFRFSQNFLPMFKFPYILVMSEFRLVLERILSKISINAQPEYFNLLSNLRKTECVQASDCSHCYKKLSLTLDSVINKFATTSTKLAEFFLLVCEREKKCCNRSRLDRTKVKVNDTSG